MTIRNNIIILLAFVTVAVIGVVLTFMFKHESKHSVTYDCLSEYNEILSDVTISSSIFLSMSPDNRAYFDIAGDLYYNDKHYKIARKYIFNYEKSGNKNYLLTNISLTKRASDSANDVQMEHLLFSPDTTSEKTMQITKIMNAYVISNFYSPLFICVSPE